MRTYPKAIIPFFLLTLAISTCYASDKAGFSRYQLIIDRNIFYPIWKSSQKTPEELEAERRADEKRLQNEQQQKLAELRKQEEERTIDTKKKQLENALELTGVLDDGSQLVAMVQNRNQNNKTLVLKKGDIIEDAKIIEIDKDNSEVTLDYQGQFKVKLSIKKE